MIRQCSVPAPTRSASGTTNVYVVGRQDGLLVDPADRADALDDVVAGRAGHLAVTHFHPDHVGAVATYAREFDLTVWAPAGRVDAFESATGIAPDRRFLPGDVLPAAGGIEVLDVPGHAAEHVAFLTDRGFLTGDLALASGSVVVGGPGADMRAYLTSLRRIRTRRPDRLYPGHGPVVADPVATCERLLRHRLDRERAVRTAVEAGHHLPAAIVDAAYEKDVSDVFDLARATVIAHLEKLAVEGAVTWDGERARPAGE